MLVSLVLALRYRTSRYMGSSYSGICLVNVLASSATGSVGINPDIFFIDLESVRDFWHHNDRGCRRMHPTRLLGLRNSLNLVDSNFVLEVPINFLSCNFEYTQFASFVDSKVSLIVLLNAAPTFQLSVCFVHDNQISCEQ